MFDHSMGAVTGAALLAAGVGLAIAAVFVSLPGDVTDLPGMLFGVWGGLMARRAGGQVGRAYCAGWWARDRFGRLRLVPRPGRNIK